MDSAAHRAKEYFGRGYNCSQSVFAVFCEKYGLDKDLAFRISCGLGGGCRSGEVCGAVSGAVLVIGLKKGQVDADDRQSKEDCYAATREFIKRFRGENGAIVCRELLGCDISTEEGIRTAREENLFKTRCVDMVRSAVGILEGMDF